MIVEIFITFLTVSLVFIFFGQTYKIPAMTAVGFAFLFVMGVVLHSDTPGSIQINNGQNITVAGSNYVVTPVYENYQDDFFGVWLMILAVLGQVTVWLTWGRKNENE